MSGSMQCLGCWAAGAHWATEPVFTGARPSELSAEPEGLGGCSQLPALAADFAVAALPTAASPSALGLAGPSGCMSAKGFLCQSTAVRQPATKSPAQAVAWWHSLGTPLAPSHICKLLHEGQGRTKSSHRAAPGEVRTWGSW